MRTLFRITAFCSLATLLVASTPGPGWAAQEATIVVHPVRPLRRPAAEVADSLFDALDAESALDRLRGRLEVVPNDFEARWRAARAALALAVMSPPGPYRVDLLREAEAHADLALSARSDHVEPLIWSAAIKGQLGIETGGPREQSRRGQKVWELAHRALAIEPNNAFAHNILGKLNQQVRKLSGLKRLIARTFLGNDAIRLSTWEDSEHHLKAAIESDPGVILFFVDLGETYLHQGKFELARETFEAGLKLPERYPPDATFKRTMEERLAAMTN